jgi:O-antigen/teichoic acid export membrane protein
MTAAPSSVVAPRRALANMVAKGASIAVEKGAQLALVLIVAPRLGTTGFGRFSYAASLSVMLAFGADLGLTIWTTRALAREPARLPAVLGTGLRLRLAASAAVLLALAAVTAAVDGADLRVAILALGTGALARALLDHARSVFRAHERLEDEARVNVVTALASVGGGLGALYGTGGGVAALAVGVMAGSLAGAGYGFALLGRRHGDAGGRWGGGFDRVLARRMLRESLPFALIGAFTLAYARGDVIVLRASAADAEVGAYRYAGQLVELAKQLPVLVLTALFPQLARAFKDSAGRLVRLENQLAIWLFLCGVVAGGVLALVAPPVIAILAPSFTRSIPTLRVLASTVPLLFLNAALLHFFIARDRDALNVLLSGVMVLINLGVNVVAAPRLGAVGSALAQLATELALAAACLYALRTLRRESARGPEPAVSARPVR